MSFSKVLASAKQLLDARGAASPLGLAEKAVAAGKFHELTYKGRPALSLAVSGDTLVLTLGVGRMEKALAASGGTNPSALQRALSADAPIALGVSFPALLAALRTLDFGPPGSRGAPAAAFVNARLAPLLGAFGDLAAAARFDGAGLRIDLGLRGK